MEFSQKQIKIMEVAEKLFAAKGFEGTSVREIAEAAGINLAMTSYYFGSKEKLMEALFTYRSEFFKLQLETMIRDTKMTPFQKMDTLIDQYIESLMNQQWFHRIMVREQMVNNTSTMSGLIRQVKIKKPAIDPAADPGRTEKGSI